MRREITIDDLAGKPHIVIVEEKGCFTVSNFEGCEAMERAHEAAQHIALNNQRAKVTVAVRVRQITSYKGIQS
ncbi:MAG: hypothetical protein MRK00_16285 [Nitrosomonas sp.]|nr:hypothetical protein [Nitrosomonas sp.]